MIKWFKTKKNLLAEITKLEREKIDLESNILIREKEKFLKDKLTLISQYESRIIEESRKAADERELAMMEIIERKDGRIRNLEIELSEQRNAYRSFRNEVRDYEIVTEDFSTALQVVTGTIATIQGRFEGIRGKISHLAKRIEKKNMKLIADFRISESEQE